MIQPDSLRPACGVRLHSLQSDAILFDRGTQRMYHLNSSASCIWRHIERNADPSLAARGIADSLGIDDATALAYIRDMVEQWAKLKLLDDGRRRRRDRSARRKPIVAMSGSGLSVRAAITRRRHYALLGTIASVGFTDNRLEEAVHPTLRHLETSDSSSSELTVDVVALPKQYEIQRDGRRLGACASLSGVAPLVNAHLFHLAIERYPHALALHSGAVMSAQGCLLLPAASGSGKSTLTAALVRAGWHYMTDDIVLLQRDSLNAVGVPNALGLKAGAWQVLASRYAELRTLPIHDRADGKRIRYVVPLNSRQSESIESAAVRWIVFPRYSTDAPSEMSPLSTVNGLCRLMAHCCGLPERLTHEQVGGIIGWISDVACFEMVFSDIEAAIRQIDAHTH